MPESSYKEKIRDVLSAEKLKPDVPKSLSGFYVFFSYDLVNSTIYKTLNVQKWPIVIYKFYDLVVDQIRKHFSHVYVWKRVGDEVLLYKKIRTMTALYDLVPNANTVVRGIVQGLHHAFDDTRTVLGVKLTIWCASVEHTPPQNLMDVSKKITTKYPNILIENTSEWGTYYDFLGPDIDLGFRIAKHTMRNRTTVSAELVYLFYRELTSKLYNEKTKLEWIKKRFQIVSYEQLKGIWSDRHYPIIWYEEDWSNMDKLFLYDEHLYSPLIKNVIDGKCSDISRVEKVFSDLDRLSDLDNLFENLKKKTEIDEDSEIVPGLPQSTTTEVHCVAICIDDDRRVLVAKRPDDKRRFPGFWEFGCGQLRMGETFEECLSNTYQLDFHAELGFFLDRAIPVSTYFFDDNDENRKIPGIIFLARLLNPDDIRCRKHTAFELISSDQIDNFSRDCVKDFKENIGLAFELFDKYMF